MWLSKNKFSLCIGSSFSRRVKIFELTTRERVRIASQKSSFEVSNRFQEN